MRSATLFVLFSAVCVAQEPAKPADSGKAGLRGEWVASRVEAPPELREAVQNPKKFRIVIDGDKLVLSAGEGKDDSYSLKLDASKSPKTIDLYRNDKLVSRGIYALETDKLQLCAGLSQWSSDVANKNQMIDKVDDRPTAFDSGQGILFVLQRAKGKR